MVEMILKLWMFILKKEMNIYSVIDILNFYNKTKKNNKIELSESEKLIVSVLKDGQLHIEKICNLLNKQVFEITPLLSILEIKGLIVKSGNVYGLTRNDLEG